MGRLIATVSVLFLPLRLAHELAHYAVASLETDDAQIGVEVFDGRAIAVWPPLESRVVRVFAFLAPSVFGVILVALWLLTGVELSGWRLPFAIGVGLYTSVVFNYMYLFTQELAYGLIFVVYLGLLYLIYDILKRIF